VPKLFDAIGVMRIRPQRKLQNRLATIATQAVGIVLYRVVAGLVPATTILLALCSGARGRRDKPGDDSATCDSK